MPDNRQELAVIERPRHTFTMPALIAAIVLAVAIAGVLFASALKAAQHDAAVTNRRAFDNQQTQIVALQRQLSARSEQADCRNLFLAKRDSAQALQAKAFGQIVIDLSHRVDPIDTKPLEDAVAAQTAAATALEHYSANPVTPCPIKE